MTTNGHYYCSDVILKWGRVFPMFVVSILPHAEFGPNDHRDAPHFSFEFEPQF